MEDEHLIVVENLSFAYESGPQALRGVSFSLHEGERLGLIGPNGAGKSTLFLCMSGVLQGFTGTICVDGLSPHDREQLPKLRQILGIVFQSSDDQLFNPTVIEDVAFGPRNIGIDKGVAEQRARSALAKVNMPPEIYERPPYRISAGQKRRAALAGVLAMEPRVLLLDEPASDLDPKGKKELIELLDRIDGAQIIAAHDLELIRKTCQRVVVIDEGEVVGDGPADEILSRTELMEAHGLEVPFSLQCCQTCADMYEGRSHTHRE